MRLGAPLFESVSDPDAWVAALRDHGYRAAYCPVGAGADQTLVDEYVRAAREADIVIAEVGAWSNPISPNAEVRDAAIAKCKTQLDLADRVGARCCVNIAGSRGEQWDGPNAANWTDETFEMIVESVRDIIDSVRPTRTFYTLETMPWIFPDTTDSYLRLIEAIGRDRFAVHLDPVNMIASPFLYHHNASFIKDCFEKLSPHVKSVHAKDITLSGQLTVHLDEVRPGLGGLNYKVFLREMSRLNKDIPLMLEHLPTADDYHLAAEYVRGIANSEGLQC